MEPRIVTEQSITLGELSEKEEILDNDNLLIESYNGESHRTTAGMLKDYVTPPEASTGEPGLMGTGSQSFSGAKTFESVTVTSTLKVGSKDVLTDVPVSEESGNILEKKTDGLYVNPTTNFPRGFVYPQFPGYPSPIEMGLPGTWTEITSQFAGLFFRAAGGNAAEFGETQAEGLPNITGTFDGLYGEKVGSTGGAFSVTSGQNKITSANWGNGRGTDFDASRSNDIYGNSEHVTPVNTALRLWAKE